MSNCCLVQWLSRSLLASSVLIGAVPAFGDTVWLKNGDRLSGKITLFDGGKLLITTEHAGVVSLDWSGVKTLESDQQLLVEHANYLGGKSLSFKAAGEGEVTIVEPGRSETVALKSIRQIMKPTAIVERFSWKGNVDIALDYKREEKDTDQYDIDYRVSVRHAIWRHDIRGEYNQESQGRAASRDNWRNLYALDRFMTEHWYWQARMFHRLDKVDEPARELGVGTGPGYQFWDNELGAFSIKTLLARADYILKDNRKMHQDFAIAGWDYNRYLLGKRVEFFATGEIQKPFGGEIEYVLLSEMGLRYKVTDWGALNIKAEHSLIDVADDGSFAKTRYTAGFGMTW